MNEIFRAYLAIFLILTLVAMPVWARPKQELKDTNFFIRDHDRVVFYGDSITDGEWYPTLVQTYILTRHPSWRNEFLNRGQSGDNGGDFPRFQRDAIASKPDALTFMMGYNDGGYRRLDSASQSNFTASVRKSVEMMRAARPDTRLFLISSTPNELAVSSDNRWVSHEWYPYHLLMASKSEAELARKLEVPFVDMTTLYGQTLGLGTVMAGPCFALSRDGVHPQQEGQTFIAYYVLRGMGADSSLATLAIDAAAKKHGVQAEHCKVTDLHLDNGALTFTRTCDSLPYPTPEVARPFSFLVQLDESINDDRLQITGLTAPAYALSIDGIKIADLPANTLAEGINLSRYTNTPMYQQAMAVFTAVRAENALEHGFWKDFIQTGHADGAGAALDEASRAAIATAQARIAAARDHCYTLNTPGPHTFKLEPLDKPVPAEGDESSELNQAFLDIGLAPVAIDWNTRTLNRVPTKLHIDNSGGGTKSGSIEWQCPAGWNVTPAKTEFTVPAHGGIDIPCSFSSDGPISMSLPAVEVHWKWSPSWPYPMTKRLDLELNPHWTIPRSTTPVTIDGNLNDWTDAGNFTLDTVSFIDNATTGKRALWGGPADLSAKFLAKWDDKAFYLAAVVRDSEHIQNQVPAMMWSQDMLQVGMYDDSSHPAAQFEFGFGAYADKDAAVTYRGAPPPTATIPPIAFKSVLDAANGTCTYEVAIPWERLAPMKPAPGKAFRFTFAVCDADSQPGKGYNYLAWTPGLAYGKNPYDMATVTLGP